MKRQLSFFLAMMTLAFYSMAQGSNTSTSSKGIILEYSRYKEISGRHRCPVRMDNIEVLFNSESKSIDIIYDGEASGKVFLYLNESVIDCSSEINTSFQISASGLYKIEIIGESWIATGYIRI